MHDETASSADHVIENDSVPVSRKILPNLDFYEANVLNAELPFEDNQFDFVQLRLVTACFTLSDWQKAMKEAIRVTKPGGYIQLLEIDHYTYNLGGEGRQWETDLIETIRQKRQMEPRMACYLSDLLKAIGAVEISSKLVSIPYGSWGLDLGILWKNNMESFAESTAPLFSKILGCTAAEYIARWRVLREEADKEKCFTNFHAAWGRKPDGYNSETAVNWSLCSPFCTNP
ncbi:hypothetical protein BD560DRAFT_338656 [Blakeslea trispora]|nr:hypothetical protein BD560DRAFT_338656 [Blakeslea trispora]